MRASPLRSNFSLRFNPHRLLGAGATRWHTDDLAGRILVSILTDSWEPVQPERFDALALEDKFQSSPTPGSRCN